MAEKDQEITAFAIKVRELISKYKDMSKELLSMQESIAIQQKQINDLSLLLNATQRDYESLKMAKMLEISGADVDEAQKRIQKLIRDVNKCITLISGEQEEL